MKIKNAVKNIMNGSFFKGWCFLSLLIASNFAYAQDQADAPTKDNTKVELELYPPWDWIQLTSGEWLKGELERMDNFTVYFNSDKLNDLKIKWDNIKAIHTSRVMAVMIRNTNTAVGPLQTKDGQLYIEDQNFSVDFDDVINIATGTHNRGDIWSGSIGASTNIRKGNVEQKDINLTLSLIGRTINNSIQLSYLGSYSENDGEEDANEHRINFTWDYRWSQRWFWRSTSLEYYRDPFQNIEQQWTMGTGLGYYIKESYSLNWVVAAGPAYQWTRYTNIPAGGDNPISSAAFFLSTRYRQELTDDIDIVFNYQLIAASEVAGRLNHHALFGLSIDITDSIDLDINMYFDRTEEPQPDDLGVIPQNNDFRVAVGLSWDI